MHKHHKHVLEQLAEGPKTVKHADVEELVSKGYIEVNPAGPDEAGNIQARIAPTATTEVMNLLAKETSPMATQFEIVDGIAPLATKRGGGGARPEQYPFSQLEVGQSFFVPTNSDMPYPAKNFASTVSGATRRFAEKTSETKVNRKGETVPVLVPTRKFTLRAVKEGQSYENGFVEKADGARVFRVA